MAVQTDGERNRKRTVRRIARRVHRLSIARLSVIAIAGIAMPSVMAVMVLVGTVKMLGGDFGTLMSATSLILPTAAILGAGTFLLPKIDRSILDEARKADDPDVCLPMLELLDGLPVALAREPVEAEVVRLLALTDEDWWQEHARDLRNSVLALLAEACAPNWLHRADGPMLPAILDTIARWGRTEYLPLVEALERSATGGKLPDGLTEAAARCGESLRLRAKHDREAATLLRPAYGDADTLLRPAGFTQTPEHLLLRPAEEAGSTTPAGAAASSADTAALEQKH